MTNFETGPKLVRMDQPNRVVCEFDWIICGWHCGTHSLMNIPEVKSLTVFKKMLNLPVCVGWMMTIKEFHIWIYVCIFFLSPDHVWTEAATWNAKGQTFLLKYKTPSFGLGSVNGWRRQGKIMDTTRKILLSTVWHFWVPNRMRNWPLFSFVMYLKTCSKTSRNISRKETSNQHDFLHLAPLVNCL